MKHHPQINVDSYKQPNATFFAPSSASPSRPNSPPIYLSTNPSLEPSNVPKMSKNLSWSANTLKPPKSIPTSVLRVQPLSIEFFGYSTLKFWDVFIEDFGSLATIPHGVAHQLSTSRSKLWIFSSNYWILYWKLRTGTEPVSFGELEIEQPFKGFEQPFFFFWSSAHIAKMCQRGPGDVG